MNKLTSIVIVTCGRNRYIATIRFSNPKDDIIYSSQDKDMLHGFIERHVYRATTPHRPRPFQESSYGSRNRNQHNMRTRKTGRF